MPDSVQEVAIKIADCKLASLENNTDTRGCFTEIFRATWFDRDLPVQWNIVKSNPGVFRGIHAHLKHSDYLIVIAGLVHFYLKDLRKRSPTFLVEEEVILSAEKHRGLYIPPGVAHGFYFPVEAMHVYSVSHYWDKSDELGCRFDDPQFGFEYPNINPQRSEYDQSLGSLAKLIEQVNK